MVDLGKNVFISYRTKYYDAARRLGTSLLQSGACKEVYVYPPEQLAKFGEIMTPHELFELLGFVVSYLEKSNTFVYLDSGDYWQSFFTSFEALYWRRLQKKPVAYQATVGPDSQF